MIVMISQVATFNFVFNKFEEPTKLGFICRVSGVLCTDLLISITLSLSISSGFIVLFY